MATIEGNIRLRSKLIRKFNKMPDAEFNELEGAVFCAMAEAADEFERQRGRSVADWAIQLLDWIPRRRVLEFCGECEATTQAEIDARWKRARPEYRAKFESTLARLRARADAIPNGEHIPAPGERATRAKALAEFMVLAWG